MHKLTLKYQSGEEIKKGDHVLFHGVLGEIDLVASDPNDPETTWYIEEYGGGIGIKEPVSGRTFISADELPECEDLDSSPGPTTKPGQISPSRQPNGCLSFWSQHEIHEPFRPDCQD